MQPSVSTDGRIAFASDRDNTLYEAYDLYVMDPDTSEVTRLTFDGDPDENFFRHDSLNPVWSPDGTRIAFDSTRSGNREVWVMNADGGGLVNVSDHPGQDYEPAWSPDGAQITFTSGRAGELDVWAVDAPPPTTSTASSSALEVGADTALAASTPRNLTRGSNTDAKSPNWGPNTRGADRMRYAPETDLRPGNHTVKVVARDPEGHLKRKTRSFDLARP